jgi:ABC-type sugar transport system substrate-binding protein
MIGSLAGCGTTSGSAGSSAEPVDVETAAIEVLQPGVHPYIAANDEGIAAAAKELGLTNVHTTQSNYDAATEAANLQNAIAKGAKAIIIQPASSTGVVPGVEQALEKGICVVALTTGPGTSTQDLYPGLKGFVGWDEYNNGELMGRAMAEGLGGEGNVVIVQGVLDNNAARDRQAGAEAVWAKEFPGITVLSMQTADFDSAKARTVTQNFIQRYGDDLDGILAITNNMASAAADAVDESALKGQVTIVSTGGQQQFIDYIKEGKAYATTPEAPVSEAKLALQLAVDCLKGDTEPSFINETDLPEVAALEDAGYVITAENADTFKAQW